MLRRFDSVTPDKILPNDRNALGCKNRTWMVDRSERRPFFFEIVYPNLPDTERKGCAPEGIKAGRLMDYKLSGVRAFFEKTNTRQLVRWERAIDTLLAFCLSWESQSR